MEGKNDGVDKVDEVMLPGFRFHPTDEELVGFYLRRKIQQRNLPIELIKQVDIYKYDPWDLPSLACTGEKEWYFYCPRDRKYRNSARPNRVTGAGFWKATGTDRPIYSSDGAKCIGLKKSLVFYRGRAAKGLKTDWMMHEFRLPSISDPTAPKKLFDKSFAANDSWAICRIFKKTNSMAQRALSHSWISPLPEATTAPGMFSSDNISCTTETGLPTPHFCCNTDVQPASTASFSALGIPSYRTTNTGQPKLPNFPVQNGELPTNFMFSPPDLSSGQPKSSSSDMASMFFNLSPTLIGDVGKNTETISFEGQQQQQQFNRFLINGDEEEENRKSHGLVQVNNQWGGLRSIGFPFSLSDGWKHDLPWDSPPCPSEMSTTYSPDKCYS